MTARVFALRRLAFCTHRTGDKCRKGGRCPVVANDWSGCDRGCYKTRSKDNMTSVPLWVLRALLDADPDCGRVVH